jgi:hypothetical protein
VRCGLAALTILLLGITDASAQPQATSEPAVSFSASVYTYLLPDEGNYAQPTIALDADWFHTEARYNYEALHAASLWAGVNFGGGETVAWEFTPMIGGVFGEITGVAPGYKGSLSWSKLTFYSESELVFDTDDSSESFFYNWSELTFAPTEWFRTGLVVQRTRVYQTERDPQRGLLVGFTFGNFDAATYVFNPDDSAPTVVLSVAWAFGHE